MNSHGLIDNHNNLTLNSESENESFSNSLMHSNSNLISHNSQEDDVHSILLKTAYDGELTVDWEEMKRLIEIKIHKVLTELNCTNSKHNIEEIENDIVSKLRLFRQPPFTLQRICELLVDPLKYYGNINKFMFAFVKLIDIDFN